MTDRPRHALAGKAKVRIGRVLSRAWEVFAANAWKFIVVMAIVSLPSQAFEYLWNNARPGSGRGPIEWLLPGLMLVFFVLIFVGQGVLLCMTVRSRRGEPIRLGRGMQTVMARFVPIVCLSFLLGLLVSPMLGILIMVFVYFIDTPLLGAFNLFAWISLLATPVLLVRWSVALPACIVEKIAAADSLVRSASLTRGHRWKIFGILLLLWALTVVVVFNLPALSFLGPAVPEFGRLVWVVIWTAYCNSILIAMYDVLRIAKEGRDAEQVAAVFD